MRLKCTRCAFQLYKVTGVKTQKQPFVTRLQDRLHRALLADAATWLGSVKATKYIVEPLLPTQVSMEVVMVQTGDPKVGPRAEIGVRFELDARIAVHEHLQQMSNP